MLPVHRMGSRLVLYNARDFLRTKEEVAINIFI